MSTVDPDVPSTGEEVHIPGPSILPLLTAVGITLILVGVTTYIELTAGGVVLSVACVLLWVRDTRRETDELPLDEH